MTFPSFPGQGNQGPVAPTPVAGGFAPVPAQAPQAPVQHAPQGFAPQPGGGFTQTPQQLLAQGFVQAPPQQAYAPQATQSLVSAADLEALRGAQMGKGRRNPMPPGDYVCVGESSELFNANAGKNSVPNRMLSVHLTVEESNNPTCPVGSRVKTSEFLDTIYDRDKQFNRFKEFCGRCYGVQSQEQLDSFDWVTPVMQPTSEVFRGARYMIKVTRVLDQAGRVKLDKKGQEVTRDMIQRIG